MKKVIFILSFFVVMNGCLAQKSGYKNQDEGKIYVNPQIPASFPAGEQAWKIFVATNLDTHLSSENGAPRGTYTVNVQFIIGMDSVMSDVRCENDPHYGMCQEAIRLVKKSGKWKPGIQNGRIVNSFKSVAIVFNVK